MNNISKGINYKLATLCVVSTILFIASSFVLNSYLTKISTAKNETIFNNNQFIQTKIVATAIEHELGSLLECGKGVIDRFKLNSHSKSKNVESLKEVLTIELNAHEAIKGYFYYGFEGVMESQFLADNKKDLNLCKKVCFLFDGAKKELDADISKKAVARVFYNNTYQIVLFFYRVEIENQKNGYLAQVIDLKPLIRLFVAPMRSGKFGAGYLLSDKGVVVYDHENDIIGKSVFDNLHTNYPDLLKLDRKMIAEDSGQAEYSFIVDRSTGGVSRKLVSWNSVKIGNHSLKVCLSAPDFEIDANLAELRVLQFVSQTLLLAILLSVFFFLYKRGSSIALKESEKRLFMALEGNRDGIWEWDIIAEKVSFSERCNDIIGLKEEDSPKSFDEWKKIIHPSDVMVFESEILKHLKAKNSFYQCEYRVKSPSGEYKWILDRGKVFDFDKNEKPKRMIGTFTDITQKKLNELEIRKLSSAVENSPSAIAITDTNGVIVYVNKSFELITQYTSAQAVGKNPSELIKSNKHGVSIYKDLWKTITSGENWRGEIVNVNASGEEYWCRLSISPVKNNKGEIINYVSIQEDLTELKSKEKALEFLATTDELTNINNRRQFLNFANVELTRSKRHKQSLAVCILDIDHFKVINDSYGHDCGDFILKELAGLIRRSVRGVDVFGRIGGEEFGLILPDTKRDGALTLLEKIRSLIEKHELSYRGQSIDVTASFGFIVSNPEEDQPLEELMKKADQALYLAKDAGRNKVVEFGFD